jgi:predicted nucleotidyltransferase
MNRRHIEERVTEELASADDQIVAAYLYGSVARGTDSSNGDIDISILLRTALQVSSTISDSPSKAISNGPLVKELRSSFSTTRRPIFSTVCCETAGCS